MIIAYMMVDYILPIFYGEEFSHSVLPFKILLFGILANCVVKIFARYIYALGAVKYNVYAMLGGANNNCYIGFAFDTKIWNNR